MVADAIGRLFRLSIRQSVKTKMKALGMTDEDWKEFDAVYDLRSRVFHGGQASQTTYQDLARRSLAISTKIVLAAVVPAADPA